MLIKQLKENNYEVKGEIQEATAWFIWFKNIKYLRPSDDLDIQIKKLK